MIKHARPLFADVFYGRPLSYHWYFIGDPTYGVREGALRKKYMLFQKIYTFSKNIHTFSKNIYIFLKTYILFEKVCMFLKKYICFLKKYVCFLKKYIFFEKAYIFFVRLLLVHRSVREGALRKIYAYVYIFRKAPSRTWRVREGALRARMCALVTFKFSRVTN